MSKLVDRDMGGSVGMQDDVGANKLLILKGREDLGDNQVYLVGLIGMERKREKADERIEGRVLLITGNPIVSEEDTHHGNKMCIGALPLTRDQRKAVLRSSQQPGGDVYLYIGNFTMGKCETARDCQMLQRISNHSILKLLSEYMHTYLVDVDVVRVFPVVPELLRGIILPKESKSRNIFGGWESSTLEKYQQHQGFRHLSGVLKGGHREFFRIWDIDTSLIVEMICPIEHWGYYVDIQLVETFVCAPNVLDPMDRNQISRVLVHDQVCIKETASRFAGRINATNEDAQLNSVPVMILSIPDYNNDRDHCTLDSFIIAHVEYDCRTKYKFRQVRLIPNARPKDKPNQAATVWYNKMFRRSNSFPPPKHHDGKIVKVPKAQQSATRVPSMVSYSSSSSSISSLAYAHCSFPVAMTIMEVDLSGSCRKVNTRAIGETYGSKNIKKCGLFFTSYKNK